MEHMTQLELFDEPTTPGCPNCVVKHLSAALSYLVDVSQPGMGVVARPPRRLVLLARALVNLNEASVGYQSHYGIAIGLLERAELAAMLDTADTVAKAVRSVRIRLTETSFCASAVHDLSVLLCGAPLAMAYAHLAEASRESPDHNQYAELYLDDRIPADAAARLAVAIDDVRNEYFNGFIEPEEKGGDEDMATTKKAKALAAKGAKACAKGAKACDKGGKSTKACDKGGKSKK